jgi:hypothetical protein
MIMTNNSEEDPPPEQWHVIHRYARQQAMEDGVLVDLTPWAREVGFIIPIACTATVWQGYVVPEPALKAVGQSERSRAHDLLTVLRHAIAAPGVVTADRVQFEVLFLMPPGRHVPVRLLAVCGPGDAGEPVITVMLPDED